jgi:hypothetical protein
MHNRNKTRPQPQNWQKNVAIAIFASKMIAKLKILPI